MNPRRAAALALGAGLACIAACSRSQPQAEANSPALEILIARCRAAVDARPNDPIARAELALAFEANGRWPEAAQHYETARQIDPNEPSWTLHAAICEAEAGKLEAARASLESGALRFPSFAPILQRLGVAQLEDGDFVRAKGAFSALANLEAHAVEGSTGIAEAEFALGHAAAALAAAERALSLDPNYRLPRYLRAECLRELGRASEAEREFELAGTAQRRMIGDDWSARAAQFTFGYEARFARATLLLDGGRAAEAVEAFQSLAKERPDDIRPLGNLAMAQAAANDLPAALASCDAALALQPKSAAMHAARARVLLGARRPQDALASARRASELAPQDARHQELLGLALSATGDLQAALQAWQEALRLDPTNTALRRQVEASRKP